jgi:uncharacterized protein (DUF2384 family)
MDAKMKQDKSKASGPKQPRERVPKAGSARQAGQGLPEQLCQFYGLGRDAVARATGVPQSTLIRWVEKSDAESQAKLQRFQHVLDGLARVMRKDFIATWLERPNNASHGRSPLQILEQGDYATIEEMIYRFEAGEPF